MTIKGEDTEEVDGGHRYAPDEDEILDTGVTYVFIGNEDIHGGRLIMNKPHKTSHFNWLVSRGYYPKQNYICVWHS